MKLQEISKPNNMKTLHEIFTEIQEAPTRAERQDILRDNDSFTLRTVLQLNFSSSITLDVPKGNPPMDCAEEAPSKPDKLIKRLGQCVKGNALPAVKKERIFIDLLESFTEEDASIICLAKDKKIVKTHTRVSASLTASVFPQLVK